MSDTTDVCCNICGSDLRPNAKFCVSCGNPALPALAGGADPGLRCSNCGGALTSGQPFCSSCGTATGAHEAAPDNLADSVVAALEGVLAPYAAVVLVERPGHKRPRRCEVVANESGRIDDAERMRFVSLLEDSLVWDGYLFAQVRAQYSPHAPCVWHVLNNETFPLAAEHAASVLLYLEALQPSQWIDSDFDAVVRAPGLDGM